MGVRGEAQPAFTVRRAKLTFSRSKTKGVQMAGGERDVEKGYSTAELVAKLRRLADALETEKPFRIQVAGERIYVPARAEFSIEHERSSDEEEVEFQFKWDLADEEAPADDVDVV